MKNKILPLFLVFALFTACSSMEKTGDAETVKVSDKVDSYACKFIGVVSGFYSTPWNSAESMVDGAMRDARARAAEQQATNVVLQGSPQIIFNSESKEREATVTVNAYLCKK
jgi:hypothetical protein